MKVVSNASPLIALASIGKLELLRGLYGKVLVPQAVWHEVVVRGKGLPGAAEVENAIWIERRKVADVRLAYALKQGLGAGEAEAIVLAIEVQADLLLMDDKMARETARYFGLKPLGVVGILIEAKHRGKISRIKPYLDELRIKSGFRIGGELYSRVLSDEGELGNSPSNRNQTRST